MIAHVRNECGGRCKFICSVCNKQFSQKGSLRTHIGVIHKTIQEFDNNVQRTYFCTNNCGRSYKYKHTMLAHVRNECGRQCKFICSICNKQCSQKGNLRRHISKVHNPIQEFVNNVQRTAGMRYFCPNNCGRSYKYKWTMTAHVRNECRRRCMFICSVCNKQFSQKGTLRSHISIVHKPILEFDSPTYISRTKNVSSSSSPSPDIFYCPNNCGRFYKYRHNMLAHLRNECGQQRKFTCTLCERKFSHKAQLQRHMCLIHGKILVKL